MSNHLKQPSFLEFLPASLFGSVITLTGLGFAWGRIEVFFYTPHWIKYMFELLAIISFIILTMAYVIKWIRFPELVKKEFEHPVSVSFFGAFIICLLLLPGIILPIFPKLGVVIWCSGAILMFLFAWIVLRKWFDHQQDPGNAMPAWLIPVVGTLDVPIVGYRIPITGIHEICLMFFGIGLMFSIILIVIIISRLLFQPPLPEALKPTIILLIGPLALAFSDYESLTGAQDMISSVFLYFDLFLLLVLGSKIVLLPRCCPFRVTWWAVGFPMVAITIASIRYAEAKTSKVYQLMPEMLLIITTGIVLYLLLQSIYRLATRQFLLSKPANEKATQILEPLKQ